MIALERTEGFERWIRGWLPREPVAARRERRAQPGLASSALLVAAVAFVAIGIGIEIVFLPAPSSGASTTTTSTVTTTYTCTGCTVSTPLRTAIGQWIADFNSRDVSGISNFYAQDSTVVWAGGGAAGSGLDGTYNGIGQVRILYGSSIGKTTILVANISNYKETEIATGDTNVSLTLTMVGVSSVVGNLSISIAANQQWNYIGGQWQIVKESWNYVNFYESRPVTSTTFPQWTAMKDGQNPNLVSEKSFEWHAGPYIAASVYAFLAGIVVFGALKLRDRSRRV